MPERPHTAPARLAIVGASSLLGQELGRLLRDTPLGFRDPLLLENAAEPQVEQTADSRRLSLFADEAMIFDEPSPDKFQDLDLVFFCGPEPQTRRYFTMARNGARFLVDLTGALQSELTDPSALLFGPVSLPQQPSPRTRLVVIANPAVQALATLLLAASACGPLRASTATVFDAASQRGHAGMNELQQQSSNLLALKPLPTRIFGKQIAFNLCAELGSEAQPGLRELLDRLGQQLRALLAGSAPLPAMQLLQGPFFHGQVISLCLQFEAASAAPGAARLTEALSSGMILHGDGAPDVVLATGQDAPLIGAVQPDALAPNTFWVFCALDNLRLNALRAIAAASALLQLDRSLTQ